MTNEQAPAKPGIKSSESWLALGTAAAVVEVARANPTWEGVACAALLTGICVTYMIVRWKVKVSP